MQLSDLFRRRHFPAAVDGPAWSEVIVDPAVQAVVVGSDQVWNLGWMRSWEPYYLLGSLPDESAIRRIAYGACFGTMNQRPDDLDRAGPLLAKFAAIGVRTETTRRIVEENFGLPTTRVVDPSLLHDFRDLRGMRSFEGPYILHYGIRPEATERGRDIAVALRRRTGLPIALIVPESYALESWPDTSWADRVLGEASPADWVESIRGCSFLVTDSFHGCVFATRASRPFLAYAQGRSAERLLDVTRHYGLEARMAPDGDATEAVDAMMAPVDFAAVHERLAVEREASLRFLREALGGVAPAGATR
ncbi:MAG: polysaccharide pyruvyl transferase family protein [Alphaproteobacteria bacterium]